MPSLREFFILLWARSWLSPGLFEPLVLREHSDLKAFTCLQWGTHVACEIVSGSLHVCVAGVVQGGNI